VEGQNLLWYRNALEFAGKLKPEIPLIGNDGIPLRDEIELEMILADSSELST
jgi:hypothetical protein